MNREDGATPISSACKQPNFHALSYLFRPKHIIAYLANKIYAISMYTFIPTPVSTFSKPFCIPTRTHSSTFPRRKQPTLCTNNRSSEFDLPSEKSQNAKTASTNPVEWSQWTSSSPPLTLPALPFPPTDVFMPGEVKCLHLYEARYLSLFESAILNFDKRCAHVVLDMNRQAMAAYGVLVHVHSWRRLDVGISVEIEAVGRLHTMKVLKPAPFLRGTFTCAEDDPIGDADIEKAKQLETRFWKAFRSAVECYVRLDLDPIREKTDNTSSPLEEKANVKGVAGDNPTFQLSTEAKQLFYEEKLKQIARRAVDHRDIEFSDDAGKEMIALRAEALSFAGWEFFPSTTKARQRAIEQKDTLARLEVVCDHLESHSKNLRAKIALQNAFTD